MHDAPSNASNLGRYIKNLGNLLESIRGKENRDYEISRIDLFLKLHPQEFFEKVNKTVSETQIKNKIEKDIELPSDAETKILGCHLHTERNKASDQLEEGFA